MLYTVSRVSALHGTLRHHWHGNGSHTAHDSAIYGTYGCFCPRCAYQLKCSSHGRSQSVVWTVRSRLDNVSARVARSYRRSSMRSQSRSRLHARFMSTFSHAIRNRFKARWSRSRVIFISKRIKGLKVRQQRMLVLFIVPKALTQLGLVYVILSRLVRMPGTMPRSHTAQPDRSSTRTRYDKHRWQDQTRSTNKSRQQTNSK
jgi:hypothetical protein